MTEPNLDIRKWLKDTGWLWHESSVITPECMDDLQAYIAQQVKEARIDSQEKWVGFLEVLNTLDDKGKKDVIKTWLEAENKILSELKSNKE